MNIDETLTLVDAVARFGRSRVAKELGCTPPALANAINVKRMIWVRVSDGNPLSALEISDFPNKGFAVKPVRGTHDLRSDISSILEKERNYQEHGQVQPISQEVPILLSG
ncbi:Cro/CI family transcriptional regulator [Pseudomonas abietaniphila]